MKNIAEQGREILRQLGIRVDDGKNQPTPEEIAMQKALASTKSAYDNNRILLASLFDVTEAISDGEENE